MNRFNGHGCVNMYARPPFDQTLGLMGLVISGGISSVPTGWDADRHDAWFLHLSRRLQHVPGMRVRDWHVAEYAAARHVVEKSPPPSTGVWHAR